MFLYSDGVTIEDCIMGVDSKWINISMKQQGSDKWQREFWSTRTETNDNGTVSLWLHVMNKCVYTLTYIMIKEQQLIGDDHQTIKSSLSP